MTDDRELVFQAASVLWRRGWLIALFAIAGGGVGALQIERNARQYESQTTLLYRFGREYFPVTPGEARREWSENVVVTLDNALFTEMRLLDAHDLYVRTVEAVPPTVPDTAGTRGATDSATALARAFVITRVKGASMITVAANDPDPARADRLVAAQIAGYLGKRRALFEPETTPFYDARISAALTALANLTRQRDAATRRDFGGGAGGTRGVAAAGTSRISVVEGTPAKAEPAAAGGSGAPVERTLAVQSIDSRIAEVRRSLKLLEAERTNAALSAAYHHEVSPVVSIIDRRPAAGNLLGASTPLRLVLSVAAGAVAGSLLVLLAAALGRGPRDRMPREGGR